MSPHEAGPVRRGSASQLVALALIALIAAGGCDGSTKHATATGGHAGTAPSSVAATGPATAPKPPAKPPPPPYPELEPAGLALSATTGFVPAVSWRGKVAAWVQRTASGVALLAFDQSQVELHLHSGTVDAGTTGWRFGPEVSGGEAPKLVAAFNGGFKLDLGDGGFYSYGRTGAPLQNGLGSIVTYSDGSTDIGSWHQEVPAPGKQVVSVRQNLSLLIDHGASPANASCDSCWGATLGGVSDPARAALGITTDGRLIWAGGEHLTVADLVGALLGAHVVRAVELDINPEWVAAYFYGHRGGSGPPAPVQAMPGQNGIPGQYLAPWSRDFFTIVGR